MLSGLPKTGSAFNAPEFRQTFALACLRYARQLQAIMRIQHFLEGHDHPSGPNYVLKYTSSARLNDPDLR
jgi:hypothetical protein